MKKKPVVDLALKKSVGLSNAGPAQYNINIVRFEVETKVEDEMGYFRMFVAIDHVHLRIRRIL